MKTKFFWLALLASAAMIAQANAGGHHGGGGGGGFAGGFASPRGGGSRGGSSGFHSGPMQSFGGGRMTYMGRGFSSFGPRSSSFRPHYFNSNSGGSFGTRQFAAGRISRDNTFARSANHNRAITNARPTGTGAAHVRNGNGALRGDWRNHVFAQRSGNWHHDWDRSRDHWWHGHRCHFVNGSWIIFDTGFYPWWPYWYNDYYAYGYPYPYDYDPGYYGGYQDEEYYGQNGDDSSDQYANATVAAVQQRLAREGYYRGEIDGVFGAETRAAVADYQRSRGLRVTGALTPDTVRALGLPRVASY